MATRRPSQRQLLSWLIQTAYLPREIPPAVTARHFADFCKTQHAQLKTHKASMLQATQFDKFSIPRENGARRELAMVHPVSQLRLSMILVEHHKEVRQLIGSMEISRYKPEPDPENYKAFRGISFSGLDVQRAKIARLKAYILNADISRFFYTIYTHSIPWAVVGKEVVKQSILAKKKLNHWTDELDKALQACQSRETFGIPVGPDTSRIVAEILMSGVHKDAAFSKSLANSSGFRLVDDFFLGFDSEPECEQAHSQLRDALGIFNLQLNDDKTWIRPARTVCMERWRYELGHAVFRHIGEKTEARDIRSFAELTIYHAGQTADANPAKWACQRLSRTRFSRKNFRLVLSILLRFGRDFPSCMDVVASFIINHKQRCQNPDTLGSIRDWTNAMFRTYAKHSNDFEVAWALVVCGALGIKVSVDDLGTYSNSVCSVVFALLGLLSDKSLLLQPLSRVKWKQPVKQAGLNGHHWLMYYESVLRKWTRDKQMIASISSDPVMGLLLTQKVSFLDTSIFGDVEINLERRRLRVRKPPVEASSFGLASI